MVESVNPADLGDNHQILVYAYAMSGNRVTLSVYDPNEEGDDGVAIQFDVSSVLRSTNMTSSRPAHTPRCFLTTAYQAEQPPFL